MWTCNGSEPQCACLMLLQSYWQFWHTHHWSKMASLDCWVDSSEALLILCSLAALCFESTASEPLAVAECCPCWQGKHLRTSSSCPLRLWSWCNPRCCWLCAFRNCYFFNLFNLFIRIQNSNCSLVVSAALIQHHEPFLLSCGILTSINFDWHFISHCMVPRLLRRRVAPLFEAKGHDFHVEYIRSVRNWKESLPGLASLSGAYRRRTKRDDTVVPHSFTFLQRCSFSAQILVAMYFLQWQTQ